MYFITFLNNLDHCVCVRLGDNFLVACAVFIDVKMHIQTSGRAHGSTHLTLLSYKQTYTRIALLR